jgi:hypothetical protein
MLFFRNQPLAIKKKALKKDEFFTKEDCTIFHKGRDLKSRNAYDKLLTKMRYQVKVVVTLLIL